MTEVFHERLKNPMAAEELKNRWKVVQKAMKEEGIDVILSQNVTNYFGTNMRYLTDLTAEHGYTIGVLLGAQGETNIVAYGGPPQECSPPKYSIRVGTISKNRPYFSPFNWSHDWEGKMAMEWLEGKKIKKFGVEMGITNCNFYNYLAANLPGVEFVDISQMMDEIRSVKTPAEINALKDSAFVLDKAFEGVPALIYEGVNEFEIRSALFRRLSDLGAEEFIVNMGSAPGDGEITIYPSFLQNRVLENGDKLYISATAAGPGGCYTTVGRMFSIGQPSKEMEESFEKAKVAQAYLQGLLIPGAEPQSILKQYNEYLFANGFEQQNEIFAYGQGYDWIERPSLLDGETMKLDENMCMGVNTNVLTTSSKAYCADSFIITDKGAQRMSRIPQKIFVV